MTVMHVDHAGFPALPIAARAVFVTARSLADEDGNVDDRRALETILDLGPTQLRFWLGHLEHRRWQRRSLVNRIGARKLWVLLAEMPGIPSRRKTGVVDDDRTPWKRKDETWRKLRAQLGGKDRALKATMAERDDLRQRLAAAERRHGLEVDPETVVLRADIDHAVRCLDPDCEQCIEIETRLECERPRYETEAGLADKLAAAAVVNQAGRMLLKALRSQGVGARSAMLQAGQALELAERGDVGAAAKVLERLVF